MPGSKISDLPVEANINVGPVKVTISELKIEALSVESVDYDSCGGLRNGLKVTLHRLELARLTSRLHFLSVPLLLGSTSRYLPISPHFSPSLMVVMAYSVRRSSSPQSPTICHNLPQSPTISH